MSPRRSAPAANPDSGLPERVRALIRAAELSAGRVDAEAVAEADAGARRLATLRAEMVAGVRAVGVDVVDGCAPFVLLRVDDAELTRKHLETKGIAVRRCDTFVGLDGEYLRAAVRPEWPLLVEALT